MKKILIIAAGAVIMPALLLLTALIPRTAIREKSLDSAEYLCEGELFGDVMEGVDGSRIDRYADSILLNIAYHLDARYPLRSVALSAYYFTPDHEENENYLIGVRDDMEINRQYLRYWHGSVALVRPLLTFLDVKGIYILNAILLVGLSGVFLMMCVRRREYALVVAYLAAVILTRCWYVPLSLEYTWTFMLMLIGSITAMILYGKGLGKYYGVFFALMGMATSFLDFLTTETITLLMPLLTLLWLGHYGSEGSTSGNLDAAKGAAAQTTAAGTVAVSTAAVSTTAVRTAAVRNAAAQTTPGSKAGDVGNAPSRIRVFICRRDLRMALACSACWLLGYALMWASKWVLCSAVMRENAMPYVSEHVAERLSGDMGVGTAAFIAGAVTRNLSCLFPLGYGAVSVIGFIALIVFALYRGFVYRRDGADVGFIVLMALIGLIPYVRFLVLHNHSYIHYFFTYRAQAATVMAIVLIVAALCRGGEHAD